MTGTGTLADPWNLAKALDWSGAEPGSTLELRGGVYAGAFTVATPGIIVRSYPGELAVIDAGAGSLTLSGEGAQARWLAVTNTLTDRTSRPADGLLLTGKNAKAIHCVSHDAGQGFGSYQANGAGVELYGCISYNQGYELDTTDRGHGHGYYVQNATGATKKFRHCIAGQGYGWNFHCYSSSQPMEDFLWEACIGSHGGLLSNEGGNFPNLRYGSITGGGGTVARHTINRFYGGEGNWDLNYATTVRDGLTLAGVIRGVINKAAWTNLVDTSTSPSGDTVYVEAAQEYESGYAHLIVYNSALASTIALDPSAVLNPGDTFGIFDGLNPLGGALVSGVYPGGKVTVTMPTTFPTPVGGWRWGAAPTRSKAFGVFVVRKTATWVAPPS